MSATEDGSSDSSPRSLFEMALENGIVAKGKADGLYRVVETGYVGGKSEVEAYLTALQHGKLIERGKFPQWKYENGTKGVYSTERHPKLPSLNG